MESSDIFDKDNIQSDSNVLSHLKKTTKDKLKWLRDLESLQTFVEKNLRDFNGKWTSPRGGCEEFKHANIILRWYVGTQSLILEGEQADVVKDILLSFVQPSQEMLDGMNSDEEASVLIV